MEKRVHIFKTMSEQEKFHIKLMLQSNAIERFQRLYQMQQFNQLLHPALDNSRKIRIGKWTS